LGRHRPLLRLGWAALVFAWAAAVVSLGAPASAGDFSTPYDPDFAPSQEQQQRQQEQQNQPTPTPQLPPELAPTAPNQPGVSVQLEQTPPQPKLELSMPYSKPFLLMDRPDPNHVFEQAPSTAPEQPTSFMNWEENLKPFQYTQQEYNKVREEIEQGITPGQPKEPGELIGGPAVLVSSAEAPAPPPPELELPTYGTSLSVTGRKVIGVTVSEKRFLYDQATTGRPQTTNLITIDQQLQLRMQGKVGPKITVNVDYDDTKPDHQDISVVYNGDPNEVVQNVSFGDIDLSLPATEFVSYNKQLFGIRADIKYRGFKATLIGSRTKGTTKSKQFFGNSQFNSQDLLDTSYVRRQYYDLTFGNGARLPLRAGSERVFLSQNNGQTAPNVNQVTLTADDLQVPSSTFTGVFQQLSPGIDYTIDYAKGVLKFQTQLLPQQVVAVDFIDNSGNHIDVETSSTTTSTGGTGNAKLVKTPGDIFISTQSEVGYNREIKTYYNIGQTQIVRDNGRGNFILRVLDPGTRNEVGSTLNPQQVYPQTINVDFENGIFNLLQPFSVGNGSPTVVDPDIYAQTPITKRIIHVEYSFRFKTFFLEPNLVPQSEVVLLDNQKLNRNVDYFIDYDAGFITFFNEQRISANSEIDISYEVAPFAGATNESLLGGRVSYDINKNASVGTTLLYDAGSKSPTVPTVTELARSLLVYDFDTRVHDVKLGKHLKLVNAAAEIAQSRQNLNLNTAALIDNMEGVKVEDAASTLAQSWFIASNPTNNNASPPDPTHVSWLTEDVNSLQINKNAQASSNQTQKVLDVSYSSLANSEEVSIVYPFSVSGVDFSQRTVLEVTMLGDNSGNDINFRLGGIDENADGTGGTTLNCADGSTRTNAPKTEDVNCNGLLDPGEDIGWLYGPINGNFSRNGASNGKIDSEDLNNNGRLDADDGNGNNFGYGSDLSNGLNPTNHQLPDTSGGKHSNIDFTTDPQTGNWITFQIPLNISSATLSHWTNIKNLRITVRKSASGNASGTLKFAHIGVIGNSWLAGTATDPATGSQPVAQENLLVTPVNNVDNPSYTPIYGAGGDATSVFNELYGSLSQLQQQSNTTNISEQALQLSWSSMTIVVGSSVPVVTTKRLFTKAIDVSQHRYFNFLVYGHADGSGVESTSNPDYTFFLRAGNDTNFFEARVPLNFKGWKKISIKQTDSGNNGVMDGWQSNTPGTVIISSGIPSLQQVAELVAGVMRNSNGVNAGSNTNQSGAVYLNEIYLDQPVTRVGTAYKFEAAFEMPGWATFGGKTRFIDRNFQTPTSVVSNQDNRQDSGYLNLTRLAFFPMNFTLQRQITDTPQVAQTGTLSNLVTQLQQGKVTTWTGTAQGNFTLGAYPHVNLGHTRNRIEYDLLTRTDDRRTYTGSMQYGVPINKPFLPKTIDLSYTKSDYDVTFDRLDVLQTAGNFNAFERGNTYAARLTFVPWTGSSFNPNYSVTKVREHRDDLSGASSLTGVDPVHIDYPKSLNQSVGFSSNFRLNRWLNPQVNYTVDTLENNILNVSTVVVNVSTYTFGVGDIKTVNRSANGSISLPLTIGDIFPKSKAFRSMNIVSGYQLQDGDVWNSVEKGLNTQGDLWLRTPLHPANPAAQLANRTLRDTVNSTIRWSPFEAYDIRGRKAAFKTLSISNNFVKSIQRNVVTGTESKTVSTTIPDLVASISQLEKLVFAERWLSNTQMNYKFSDRKTETIGQTKQDTVAFGTDLRTIVLKRFDSLLSMNLTRTNNLDLLVDANTQKVDHEDATAQVTFDVRKFRFTPKTDYAHDKTVLGSGVKTQDLTVVTPSLLVRADLALPRGLLLPGSTKTILFSNRIIWTTTLSMALRSSPVSEIDNNKLASFNTSADYELAKNLRMTLNGAVSRLWSKFLKTEDYLQYQFGSTLTFQF